jgi:hypothetical protein
MGIAEKVQEPVTSAENNKNPAAPESTTTTTAVHAKHWLMSGGMDGCICLWDLEYVEPYLVQRMKRA